MCAIKWLVNLKDKVSDFLFFVIVKEDTKTSELCLLTLNQKHDLAYLSAP